MAPTVNILFSQPPPHVSEAEFTEWYEAHMIEILGVEKFKAAQLFRLDTAVGSVEGPVPYTFAVIYEVDGDWAGALAEQDKASYKTYEQYVERKKVDPSGPPIPPWLTETRFAWWNGIEATDRLEASD